MIGNVHCQRSTRELRARPKTSRIRIHFTKIIRAAIEAGEERSVVAAGVEDVRVQRVWCHVARLGAAGTVECRRATAAASTPATATTTATAPAEIRVARNANSAAILLGAADVIRHVARRCRVVILRRGKVLRRPRRRRRGPLPCGCPEVNDTAPPPSLPSTRCFGSSGSIHRSW